jgi:hypothetical protein
MLIVPEDAAEGTVTSTVVLFTTAKEAETPPTVAPVAPERLVPVTTTIVPTGPEVGVNEVIVGAGTVTVKFDVLEALFDAVSMTIEPVVAVAGTVTSTVVLFTTV